MFKNIGKIVCILLSVIIILTTIKPSTSFASNNRKFFDGQVPISDTLSDKSTSPIGDVFLHEWRLRYQSYIEASCPVHDQMVSHYYEYECIDCGAVRIVCTDGCDEIVKAGNGSCDGRHVLYYTVSGSIQGYKPNDWSIVDAVLTLTPPESKTPKYTTTGTDYYRFDSVEAGKYILTISAQGNWVNHNYEINVQQDLSCDVTIYELGDVNADGKLDYSDIEKMYDIETGIYEPLPIYDEPSTEETETFIDEEHSAEETDASDNYSEIEQTEESSQEQPEEEPIENDSITDPEDFIEDSEETLSLSDSEIFIQPDQELDVALFEEESSDESPEELSNSSEEDLSSNDSDSETTIESIAEEPTSDPDSASSEDIATTEQIEPVAEEISYINESHESQPSESDEEIPVLEPDTEDKDNAEETKEETDPKDQEKVDYIDGDYLAIVADVNGDGIFDEADQSELTLYLSNEIDSLPANMPVITEQGLAAAGKKLISGECNEWVENKLLLEIDEETSLESFLTIKGIKDVHIVCGAVYYLRPIVSVTFDPGLSMEEQASLLAENDHIISFIPDYIGESESIQVGGSGADYSNIIDYQYSYLNAINLPSAWTAAYNNNYGYPITVCVIDDRLKIETTLADTSIDYYDVSSPNSTINFGSWQDYIYYNNYSNLFNNFNDNGYIGLGVTHGTQVMSVLSATALMDGSSSGADCSNIHYCFINTGVTSSSGYNGFVSLDYYLSAEILAINLQADVVNMSWRYAINNNNANSLNILHNIIAAGYSYGITYVAAAGNDGDPSNTDYQYLHSSLSNHTSDYIYNVAPGCYNDCVINVGALMSSDLFNSSTVGNSFNNIPYSRATFSNYNSSLDISAPGTWAVVAGQHGSDLNMTVGYGSGTSFAAPIVTGVISLMLTVNPFLSNSQIYSIVTGTATDIVYSQNIISDSSYSDTNALESGQLTWDGTLGAEYASSGYDIYTGYGMINAYSCVLAAIDAVSSSANYVTVEYYGYGEGTFLESQYLYSDVFYVGVSGQTLRSTSYASTGYIATGWSESGYSLGDPDYTLGNEVWDSWIINHSGQTVRLVQTYAPNAPATVTVRYYSYGEGYVNNTYFQGSVTYTYGVSNQHFWNTSYATTGYYATGWNLNGNSWGTVNLNLGANVTDSWIHSHAGETIDLTQTFSAETVIIKYYAYGEGYFDTLKAYVTYTYGASNQHFLGTSYATTGYVATGWNMSGNSWGNIDFPLNGTISNAWIHAHAGQTIQVVQTFRPEQVTVRYYSYGEGYPDNSYYQGYATYYYGYSGQAFWSTSYATSGYYATGWNTSCNSWGTVNLGLGGTVFNSWIHSHAGQTVNMAQTFRSY